VVKIKPTWHYWSPSWTQNKDLAFLASMLLHRHLEIFRVQNIFSILIFKVLMHFVLFLGTNSSSLSLSLIENSPRGWPQLLSWEIFCRRRSGSSACFANTFLRNTYMTCVYEKQRLLFWVLDTSEIRIFTCDTQAICFLVNQPLLNLISAIDFLSSMSCQLSAWANPLVSNLRRSQQCSLGELTS
jgi:hypothetical protein